MRRLTLALALALLPALLAPSASGLAAEVTVPGPVPVGGTPFDAHVRLAGVPSEPVELKLWLGGERWQASRTWNGTAFERSDRYTLTVQTPNGSWAGWVPLRANPTSTNHARLEAGPSARVGLRVRAPNATASATIPVDVHEEVEHAPLALRPGSSAWVEDGQLLAHRTNPTDAWRILTLALPLNGSPRACAEPPCRVPDGLVLDRVGEATVRVRNTVSQPVELAGAVAVLEEGLCALDGELAPGQRARFALPGLADAEPAGSACLATLASGRWRPGTLFASGRPVDRAPDPPGWGQPVREGWPPYRWAPWRLPTGVEPKPFSLERVRGHASGFATRTDGLAEVLRVIGGARERLTVATYLLTNDRVAAALADAARQGVGVDLLLEPSPVGGLPDEERRLVDGLEDAGVQVRWFDGPIHTHGLQHAKVLVADGAVLLVLTENLTEHGLPADGEGNLGLGFGVVNASLARRVEALVGDPGPSRPWIPEGWQPFDGRIGLLTSPGNAWRRDAVPAWAREAGRLDALALRVDPRWGPRSNAWVEALVEASRERPVRLLASGTPAGARSANRLALSYLEGHPDAGNLTARLASPRLGTVHAKALLGSEATLVGSSNWGIGGVLLNREVGLIVEDAATARVYGGIFDRAWNGTGRSGPMLPAPGGLAPGLLGLATVSLGLRKKKKGEEGEPSGSSASSEADGPVRAGDLGARARSGCLSDRDDHQYASREQPTS